MAKKKKKAQKTVSKSPKKAAPSTSRSSQKDRQNNSPVQPLLDRVLVKREDVDVTSPSGIIIPDSAKTEKSKRGVVIAVGPGRTSDEGSFIPTAIEVGAKVFFNSGWDNEVKIGSDNEEFFLVREADILAIVK